MVWMKKCGIVFIGIMIILLLLMMRIFYISFGPVYNDVKSVAGGKSAKLNVYNSKGIIYDCNLSPIAGGQFVYYLIINPRDFDRSQIEYLSVITKTKNNELVSLLNSEKPFVLKSYYSVNKIDGVSVIEGTTRYPESSVSQHLLGYLDSNEELGMSGIEKIYDDILSENFSSVTTSYSADAVHGIIPGDSVVLNNKNHVDTSDGVVLTIDKQLSLVSEEIMSNHFTTGCVIVMNCHNGDILALSSSPEFDVNNISSYLTSDNGELINNAMVNQTVGSVFKIVVAAAALENDYENFTYECNGGISIGGRVFSCQHNKRHGQLNLSDAFSNSCNAYFIALGQLLGYETIVETAELLGMDSSIRICNGMFSSSGIIPAKEGNQALANLSIGQGGLMISPLQIARITAAICNGGYLINPTVYEGIYKNNAIINKSDYSYKSQVLSKDSATKLKNMSINCVTNGTGSTAMPSLGGAGGKTASAQTGKISEDGNEVLNTYFTGFYPADEPQYVITVFAIDGESGSKTCAPVFREICEFISLNY